MHYLGLQAFTSLNYWTLWLLPAFPIWWAWNYRYTKYDLLTLTTGTHRLKWSQPLIISQRTGLQAVFSKTGLSGQWKFSLTFIVIISTFALMEIMNLEGLKHPPPLLPIGLCTHSTHAFISTRHSSAADAWALCWLNLVQAQRYNLNIAHTHICMTATAVLQSIAIPSKFKTP